MTRRWHWLRRFWNAWEWACIRAVEEWFSTFSRAWLTGSGDPPARRLEAPAPPLALAPSRPAPAPVYVPEPIADTRRGAIGLATPVREAPRVGEIQPRMDERAIVGGLKQLGYPPDVARKAAAAALRAGLKDESDIMRRALNEARGPV